MNPLPYGRQWITEADIQAVTEVLRSDWLTQGPAIERFERKVAEYCGAKHALALSSATAALHIGALALDLGPGDRLWTSPNTFVASANCARYCGAEVDFVDIDPRTYNLSVEKLTAKLEQAAKEGKLPKIVVPVDFSGQSCELDKIQALAKKYGFAIMQDASHAIGAKYQGLPTGDGRFSDLTVFSFHPVKIITTGEGGMIMTNRTDLYEKLLRLRSHGITREAKLLTQPSHGPWYYEQLELGYNYRITDIQAALGASQMERLEEFVTRRRVLAARYNALLLKLPLTLPYQHPDTNSSWHLYVIRLQLDRISKTHRQVFEELRANGIGVQLHYIPVHTQPYYQELGFKKGDFPVGEKYYGEAISLPMFAAMTDEDQDRVVATLSKILG
ncbi:MAG: UDP-4-amino-4,6-dideoxy-N-acetyl-beta-L-altrosamine transaminase [Verrucomicrobia bacterium]|jgi:UDP-4-amino-4,6-dideoxy-N-acetyl-beta-L-altrosamine transaminase|nr:UDP-4-amino-4,6-dideoxy-N-acetyl-beta-L-altrosamine transaminase [Verrucomicrobiota bacterium]